MNQDLDKVFNILTQDPFALQHHQAKAFLISQYIQGSSDPIKATKENFKENGDIFNDINAVGDEMASGVQARYFVKKFGMLAPYPEVFNHF